MKGGAITSRTGAGSGRLGRAAAPDGRPLLAEGRVGECLERLVQVGELVRDAEQMLVRVESPVERVHLVAEPVEALEDCVELTVVQVLALRGHRLILASRCSSVGSDT